jgi:hypothetical protein
MAARYLLLPVGSLHAHEAVDLDDVGKLVEVLRTAGVLAEPIWVADGFDVILNGHVHSPRVSVEYTGRMLGRTRAGPPPVVSCARCVFDEANDPTVSSGYSIIGLDFEYERVAAMKVWEVQFDRSKVLWYYDEAKQTYPMVVKIPAPGGVLSGSSRVGPKVTDEERQLLRRWKEEGTSDQA